MSRSQKLLVLFALILVPTIAIAQRGGGAPPASAGPFGALRWRSLGPDRGGRSIAVAGSDARPYEYYMGATGGGLWKTTDAGISWKPVTDGQIGSSSVGAVAVSESSPDVVYIVLSTTRRLVNGLITSAGERWVEDLPQQVTSQEVVIPADQTAFSLRLAAGPNSQAGTFGVRVSSSATLVDRKDQEFKIPDLKASLDVLAGSAALK
jgi:hypothetical protein